MDASQPLEFLLSLLDQIAKEDPSNVFEYPVDGSVVKGYYDKIKQPMCFYVMREKLRKQEYRTWRSFTKDFELICENAKLFNPPQNRVHKLAINLQRAGRKVLQGNELPGRRSLSMLHPEGPKQAAEEEAAEILVTKNDPQYSSQLLLTTDTDEKAAAPADDRQDQQQGHAVAKQTPAQPVPEDLAAAHQLWEATCEQLTPADWGLLFRELPDPQLDNVTQQLKQPVVYQPYSSLEPQQQQQQPQAAAVASTAKPQLLKATADWLLARQPVTWRCQWLYTRIQELTSMIGALQSQGSTVPISFPAASGAVTATTPGATAAAAAAAAGGAEGLLSSSSATEAVEGLSLLQVQQGGMLLQQHVAAAQQQGPVLQTPFFAAHTAGTYADPLPPEADKRVAQQQGSEQKEQQQVVQQQPEQQQQKEGQGESSKQPAEDQQQQQQQQQDTAADMDVDQPAECDTATAKDAEAVVEAAKETAEVEQQQQQVQQQQQATNSGTAEQVGTAAAAAADEVISKAATPAGGHLAAAQALKAADAAAVNCSDNQQSDAALIFSSLELVEHQLVAARLMIARAFGIEATLAPTGVRLGQYTAARVWGDANNTLNPAAAAQGPGGQKRSAATAGLGLARGLSGALDRGPGQGRGLQREGSLAGSIKKRRVERSGAAGVAGSIDADDGVLSPSSSLPARLLERVVTSIHIPSVREIPKEEQEALSAAATTWRAAVKAHGQRAGLAKPPAEVRRVLEAAAADEGSSSEDTSDEAYAIMHKPLEEDEHIRLCGPTGGGRKRNKNKTKQSGSKQQQQGKSEQQPLGKQQQQQAAQEQPGSPRPARGKGNAANGASAAAATAVPNSVAAVPVVSQAVPAPAAAVPPLKASIDSSKLPPAITIPGSLPTSPNKLSRTSAASPVVAAAAAALAAAAAGTASPAGLRSASPASATAAGGVLQLGQQQVLWLQHQGGQPVMVLTPGVAPPSTAAASTAEKQQQQQQPPPSTAGSKQASGAAAGARSGGAAAAGASGTTGGGSGAGAPGSHSTRSRELPARLTSTQLASTRTNGTIAGSGSSKGIATRTHSGGIRDKDIDKVTAAAAGDKAERGRDTAAGSGRGAGSGRDKDAAASSGKQQVERGSSSRKTVSPAAGATPTVAAAAGKDVTERSKSPAVVKSPSAAAAGTVAAGTRRASAAAAAAATVAKRRSSNRVKAQEAVGKVKGKGGK